MFLKFVTFSCCKKKKSKVHHTVPFWLNKNLQFFFLGPTCVVGVKDQSLVCMGENKNLVILGALGGGFKYVYFHPYLGKISDLTTIVRMGLKPPTRVKQISNYNYE